MTTPLLLLRAMQLGVQIGEMDLLTIGTINDMYTEMSARRWRPAPVSGDAVR